MTSHLINNMRALARAHGETFDFLLENQAVLVQIGCVVLNIGILALSGFD